MTQQYVREMGPGDLAEAASLQSLAFPPPFPQHLLWQVDHLRRHWEVFPEGQFVAIEEDGERKSLIGSCSNSLISEGRWQDHMGWDVTVGGPFLETFDPTGTTLYGLDVTVHPNHRRIGVGRAFYAERFELVRQLGLVRYGTACRMPDYVSVDGSLSPQEYAERVVEGTMVDRTLTPLLRYGLTFLGVIENYMEDSESGNAGALLEWTP